MIFSSQGRSDLAKLIACPFNAKVSQGTDVTLSDSSLLTLMKQEATSWRGPCNQKWSRAPSQQRAESCSRPSNNSRDLWTTCQQPQELGDGPFHSQGVRWDLSPTQDLEFTPGESPLLPSGSSSGAKSLLSCPTLCDPMDCSTPGSTVHGILQARLLEWVHPLVTTFKWETLTTTFYLRRLLLSNSFKCKTTV